MKKLIPLALCTALTLCLFAGCKKTETITPQTLPQSEDSLTSPTIGVDFSQTDEDMFSDRDLKNEYDSSGSTQIQLNGTGATCSSPAVSISGSTVTISAEGTYILSGTLNNGSIIVNAGEKDKIQLVLNGVQITNATGAAISVTAADKVFVTTAKDTDNSLANGGSFADATADAALFSRQDLTVNGNGKLTVTSPAGHGISCKDDLVISGGSYTISSASHGVDANDSIRITGSTFTIDSGKDGIHAENNEDSTMGFVYISDGTFHIESEGDGISADLTMQIVDGTFNVIAGGGSENSTKEHSDGWGNHMGGGPGRPGMKAVTSEETDTSTSMKGIKAGNGMLLSGGSYNINSADDSIHAASVTINGGSYNIASGDDAIHADDALSITNGTISVTESYEGLEAQDVLITGGAITMTCTDDGINAAGGNDASGTTGGRDQMFAPPGGPGSAGNGSITISGGNLYIKSSGDGIDANGTLTISGGKTVIVGPTQGDTATLDYDSSGIITGGTFIGTGGAGMAQTFSGSEQGVISVSVGNQSANTSITLTDSEGTTILSHAPEMPFAVVILSSPDMVKGESYTITVGSQSETFTAS